LQAENKEKKFYLGLVLNSPLGSGFSLFVSVIKDKKNNIPKPGFYKKNLFFNRATTNFNINSFYFPGIAFICDLSDFLSGRKSG